MRNQTPVAAGLSISESKRKVDRGRWVWPISRGDWHRWDRQPIRRTLAPESPGPHFPPFSLTPGAEAAELGSAGAVLLSLPLLRPLLRTRGAWRLMASSGSEDLRGQEDESFLYFAYGSNLLTERIQLRNPSAAFWCVARLQDFKLDFGNFQGKTSETWHGGVATIFQSPGDEVWGVVWKMNKSNLSSLDKQEGVNSGKYAPMEINVYTQEGKKIACRSYQMRNYESAPPSPQYKKVICMGAKENGLPLEYQKKLNAIEPNDYRGKVSEEIEDIIKSKETNTH